MWNLSRICTGLGNEENIMVEVHIRKKKALDIIL